MSAPTAPVGAIYYDTGSLSAGNYSYGFTYVTAFGETMLGSTGAVSSVPASGSVNLTTIPSGPDNVINRKIYRTTAGGTSYLLLDTIDARTTTSYIDRTADASLGAAPPTSNTAYSKQVVNGLLQVANPILRSVTVGLVAHAGGGQTLATPLASEYNLVATVATIGDSSLLPVATSNTVGQVVTAKNAGVASMNVFPAVGQTINGGAADASVALASGAVAYYVQTGNTSWTSF